MTWDVLSGATKTAWDVLSGVTKTAWDVLSRVANLCGMFCQGCQKMAWDVLSRDVLSGSQGLKILFFLLKIISKFYMYSKVTSYSTFTFLLIKLNYTILIQINY